MDHQSEGDWLNSQPVNLTISLGKAFDVTYIRLRFHSPRPESFAIYKRTSGGTDWVPFQFYSASCDRTYSQPSSDTASAADEAICTDEYSDMWPFTDGSVAFSTLQGRPGSWNFESSPILQEWVTATDIRIVLTRMNTQGDEVYRTPYALRSYFYAIDDISIGARCKCNGHASRCEESANGPMVCECHHNTAGPDCNTCKPFYNDRPWARATDTDVMECLPCDCNGFSEECYFDEDLYRRTGHGGHCTSCREGRGGVHCELTATQPAAHTMN